MSTLITNVIVIDDDFAIARDSQVLSAVAIIDGRISQIMPLAEASPSTYQTVIDGQGGYLLPGFIDLHVHGGGGYDFMTANAEQLAEITRYHASCGTTTMLATTTTASREALDQALATIEHFKSGTMPNAQIYGVHLEGPFLNKKRSGAQNPAYLFPPQIQWLQTWEARHPQLLKIVTLAPELEGADETIDWLTGHGIVAACGHTDATFAQIEAAADRGLNHAIHTFNAMSPIHHREPGTVGAALIDPRLYAEVIADGLHVHPACIRMMWQLKPDRAVLITDAIAAAGCPDGDYELGGLAVVVKDGAARLREGGNLAGSTLNMVDALRFAVNEALIPLADASRMASLNPARLLGIDDQVGRIKSGYDADLLLLDTDLHIQQVWIKGNATN